MIALAKEVARLVDSMPRNKAQTVIDFARFLAEKEETVAWRKLSSSPNHARKLKSAAERARKELRARETRHLTSADF